MPRLPYASPSTRSPAPPRGTLGSWPAIIVAILAVPLALVYARGSAGVVVYRLLTDGMITLGWVMSGAGWGALVLRGLTTAERINDKADLLPPPVSRGRAGEGAVRESLGRNPLPNPPPEYRGRERILSVDGLLYFVTATALGLGLIGLITLALGLAGFLSRMTAIALLPPGVIMGAFALWRHMQRRPAAPIANAAHAVDETSVWTAAAPLLWLAAVPFLAISLLGTLVPPGLLWAQQEPNGYDVVEYHLQVPREWYEAGRIIPLKHNVFAYFPMGVEVHFLLAMELDGGPWEGMYLAQMMHLSLIVLTVMAAWAVARRFASTRASATMAAVALATLPWMAQLGAIAYVEGGFLLFSTLSIGWVMLGLPDGAGSRSRLGRFALAGTMAGFACGTKLTAVPELLICVPLAGAILWMLRYRSGAGHFTKAMIVYVLAGAITFSPWLARNAAWAGNPVFPEAANVLGKAHWTQVQVERWIKANHEPGADARGVMGHVRAIWDQLLGNWQFGFLLLPLGLIAMLLAAHPSRAGLRSLFPALMLLLLSIFWLGFTHLQSRFFLLAAPLAALLIAQVDWGRWIAAVTALVLAAALVGFWGLHSRFVNIIYRGSPGMSETFVDTVGRTDLQWLNPSDLDPFPRTADALRADPNAQLALIGDSTAFLYQIPMSRLHYRTIFDLNTSGLGQSPDAAAIFAAWEGLAPGKAPSPNTWLLIDGSELKRFSQTYFDVPAPPEQWTHGPVPRVVAPK